MRTAACSALLAVLAGKSIDCSNLLKILPDILPSMNSLVEDSADKVRLFVVKAFSGLFDIGRTAIPPPYLMKSCSSTLSASFPSLISL